VPVWPAAAESRRCETLAGLFAAQTPSDDWVRERSSTHGRTRPTELYAQTFRTKNLRKSGMPNVIEVFLPLVLIVRIVHL
jgi:hypothetical protein